MNKLVVTDEMLEVALETFRAEKYSAINHNDPRCMKAAIQAVFDMVNQHTDIGVGDTKMEQEKPSDDGWGFNEDGRRNFASLEDAGVMPTPKQTLLEYVNTKVAWCKNKEEALNYQLLKLISEYLEERLK